MVVIGGGPSGTGMEETYQLTSALKHISWGKTVSLITDARFSGVSTGACFGHVAPEALAGGPIGKLRDNDIIEIIVDRNKLTGSVNFIGTTERPLTPEEGRMNWRCAPRILNCVPMRFYLMIPACGRRYSLLAVEPGEVVFTIPIKLSTSLTPVKKRSDCS
jgi:hypothetical protein